MKKTLRNFGLLFFFLIGSLAVEAHTTQIYTVDESDGSITFYARTYHGTRGRNYGGIILNSTVYRFTGVTNSVPSGANLIVDCASWGAYYQTVNVKLCGVTCSVTTTRTSAVEAPYCGTTGSVTFGGVSVSASTDASPVYYGYSPLSCANLSSSASGGAGSYSYSWSNGDTTSTSNVCPTSSTTYTVTATDGNGCSGSASVDVDVIDVRCGSKMDKVTMCKATGKSGKTFEICVAASAVPAHLSNGSTLGPCPLGKVAFTDDTQGLNLETYPNPFSSEFNLMFRAVTNEHIKIEAFDLIGRSLGILFEEDVEAGVYYNGNVNTVHFPTGMIIVRMEGNESVRNLKLYRR